GNSVVWILAYPKWTRRILGKPAKSPAVTFCEGTAKMSAAVHVPETEPLCPGPSGHAALPPPPQKNTTTEPVFCGCPKWMCAACAGPVSSVHVRVHEMLAPSALSLPVNLPWPSTSLGGTS